MPLPFWDVEKITIDSASQDWNFKSVLLITCPRCKNSLILSKAWPRKNAYGTAPCPFCFKTNRIPNRRRFRTPV